MASVTDSWSFYALGTPAAQGSKRHVGRGVMIESSKAVKPWRDTITAAAFGAGPCLNGPIAVRMIFTVPRPKSARKTDVIPCRRPDLSKEARCVEDAITDAGLWADDARVAEYTRLAKVYPGLTSADLEALPVPGVIVAACSALDPYVVSGLYHECCRVASVARGLYRRNTEKGA